MTADLNSPLAAGTASVGAVINGGRINDLPVADRNTLSFVNTQGAVVESNIAGAQIAAVNVVRDSIPVSHEIINDGVNSVVYLSADLVDEIRVVTSPADAELGRGSGQVQIVHAERWQRISRQPLRIAPQHGAQCQLVLQ